MQSIAREQVVFLDTEGTGLVYPKDRAFGISICGLSGWSGYVDSRYTPDQWNQLGRELSRFEGRIVAHNMSFDYRMLKSAGIRLPMGNLDDTVIRAVCIDENHGVVYPWTQRHMSYSLEDLARYYLKEGKDESFYDMARQFFDSPKMTKNKIMSRIEELPREIVEPYAVQDAVVLRKLWLWQEEEIRNQGLEKICEFEREVLPVLIRAECRGIRVDEARAEEAADKIDIETARIKAEIDDAVGKEFNANSPKQMRELFEPEQGPDGTWFANDGTPIGTTDKGGPSFGGSALRNMVHPLASKIVELRSMIKTSDTFLRGHVMAHAVNGKVYPTINQTASEDGGTRTGRLSYTNPAMQQIPSRNKKVAEIVKPVFLAPEGMKWVDADMQSFEVRIFAHLVAAYDRAVADAYAKDPNADFHQWVADLTNLVRNAEYSGQPNAKQLNLSMIFNSGKGAIAEKMGMDWSWSEFTNRQGDTIRYRKPGKEALKIIELYHKKLPGVALLADKAKNVAEKRGYIRTSKGRRLRFRRGYKSYSASGLLIQATAADINKENWILTEQALGEDGFLMLNTHDSYSMAIREDWKPPYNRVKEALERPALRVPLVLELSGVGNNWWEALQGEK